MTSRVLLLELDVELLFLLLDEGTLTLIVLVVILSLGISVNNVFLCPYKYMRASTVLSITFLGALPFKAVFQSPCSYILRQTGSLTLIEDF